MKKTVKFQIIMGTGLDRNMNHETMNEPNVRKHECGRDCTFCGVSSFNIRYASPVNSQKIIDDETLIFTQSIRTNNAMYEYERFRTRYDPDPKTK